MWEIICEVRTLKNSKILPHCDREREGKVHFKQRNSFQHRFMKKHILCPSKKNLEVKKPDYLSPKNLMIIIQSHSLIHNNTLQNSHQ